MTDINNGWTTSKPPQISGMFQKFALAFKAKTFELFADEDGGSGNCELNCEGLSLLDSAEEVITGQRVVVIKPDNLANSSVDSPQSTAFAPQKSDALETQVSDFGQIHTLIEFCRLCSIFTAKVAFIVQVYSFHVLKLG